MTPDTDASGDRRQCWWRSVPVSLSWSVGDFTGPERLLVAAAEVENLQHHLRRVSDWFALRDEVDPAWVSAAFSTDATVAATPTQLAELGRRLDAVVRQWTAQCRADKSPGQEPVFVFAHGVPSLP